MKVKLQMKFESVVVHELDDVENKTKSEVWEWVHRAVDAARSYRNSREAARKKMNRSGRT